MPAAGSIPKSAPTREAKSISHEHTYNEDTADRQPARSHADAAFRDGGTALAGGEACTRAPSNSSCAIKISPPSRAPTRCPRLPNSMAEIFEADSQVVSQELEARHAGAIVGSADVVIRGAGRSRSICSKAGRSSAGKKHWRRPTGCATSSANRASNWRGECEGISASGCRRIPPGCREKIKVPRLLQARKP